MKMIMLVMIRQTICKESKSKIFINLMVSLYDTDNLIMIRLICKEFKSKFLLH